MNLLNPGFSSSVGYAWKVQPVLKVLKTVLNGQLEYISPGYQSLGAPNLRNDNFKLAGGIARDFFDHSVLLSASASTEHDNLFAIQDRHTHETLDLKTQTTRFNSYDANLELSFPNLPYLQVSYDPYSEHNSTDSTFSNVISASAGYDFTIGKVSHSPGLTVSYSDSRGDTTGDYTDWDASLNYGLTFEFPLGLSASCGYSRSVTHAVADSRLSLDVTPSYTAFTVWRNSLSLGGTFIGSTRVDIRYSSSFPIGKICDATIGAAGTTYQGNDGRYYNEISLTGEIRKSW
jgi:hypothetical protein